MSRIGVSRITAVISTTIRRITRSATVYERTAAYTATTIDITAAGIAIRSERKRKVARNRLGSVVMSPSAVTIGVDTESRAHPRREERAENRGGIIRTSAHPIR